MSAQTKFAFLVILIFNEKNHEIVRFTPEEYKTW